MLLPFFPSFPFQKHKTQHTTRESKTTTSNKLQLRQHKHKNNPEQQRHQNTKQQQDHKQTRTHNNTRQHQDTQTKPKPHKTTQETTNNHYENETKHQKTKYNLTNTNKKHKKRTHFPTSPNVLPRSPLTGRSWMAMAPSWRRRSCAPRRSWTWPKRWRSRWDFGTTSVRIRDLTWARRVEKQEVYGDFVFFWGVFSLKDGLRKLTLQYDNQLWVSFWSRDLRVD